ncbi:MAG: hypothetical protein U1E10_06645 [Bdellovibrionales bacterium]|nr:hypothetical protein [Bdellovibrionales bacterium]
MCSRSTISIFASVGFAAVIAVSTALLPLAAVAQNGKSVEDCIREFEALREALRGGQQTVTPSAGTRATKLLDIQAIDQRLKFDQLTDVQEIDRKDAMGLGYYKAFVAKLDGKKVFAKVSYLKPGEARAGMRRAEHIRNEAAWVKRLSELGIGPKFHGLSYYEDRHTIVTEFIDGIHFDKEVAVIPQDFNPTRALLESLENIQRTLESEGVVSTDLQLRITPTRAVVIDPEMFEPATRRDAIYNSQADLRNLIDYIRMMIGD